MANGDMAQHGIYADPKPPVIERFKQTSCLVRGSALFEEPGTPVGEDGAGTVWPCIWIDSTHNEGVRDLPALIRKKKRMKLIAALSDDGGPVCRVTSDWDFLLSTDQRKYSYARLTVTFHPPVDVVVPVLFVIPRHLQTLATIYTHAKLMFSASTPGNVFNDDFIFLDIPPTDELQTVLTSEIYRAETAPKGAPKMKLKNPRKIR